MALDTLIQTRQGICSLVATVLSLIVAIMYRAGLKDTSSTDNWTGDSRNERWTDMGMLAVGTIFGLPGAYMTHAIAYVQGHRDTPADFVRMFLCGAMSLCSAAMLLAVGDQGAADQGRALGIIMGVLLLFVSLAQWYHVWCIFAYMRSTRADGSDAADGYYGGGRSPHYAVKVASSGQPISRARDRPSDEPPTTVIPLMSSDHPEKPASADA